MKCDVCGKQLDSDNYVIYEEIKGARLCQICFESVSVIVDKGAVRAGTTRCHEPSQVAHCCQLCGGIRTDVSNGICTECGAELNQLSGAVCQEALPLTKPTEPSKLELILSTLGKIFYWTLIAAGLIFLVFFVVCFSFLMNTKF
ncbi:MAG: hypothetical protein HXX17_13245 [Geobacteraceae bacterium]|nr:hypothetical protein [Geobacteraceae bacterium]